MRTRTVEYTNKPTNPDQKVNEVIETTGYEYSGLLYHTFQKVPDDGFFYSPDNITVVFSVDPSGPARGRFHVLKFTRSEGPDPKQPNVTKELRHIAESFLIDCAEFVEHYCLEGASETDAAKWRKPFANRIKADKAAAQVDARGLADNVRERKPPIADLAETLKQVFAGQLKPQ